jgi:dipeptidyl aminopeptidase/acylaminoacyl peptidase
MAHSGPTSYSPAVFSLVKQFFTSRGIGVLDVNYVGSTTMGRRSRQSLNGQWGVVDVSDCVQHALGLVADGKADPKRLAIMGSSAGGFTALAAATTTTVFSACISLYGIADLALLDTYSERFESHYTSTLLGASSRDDPIWAIRSPIKHVDQLSCPILLLQGEDDTVVLPHQAHVMFQAAQERGFDAEVIVFPGEGHGFRQASTIERAYQAILDFLGHTWGFTPDASSDTSPVHQG